MKQLGILVLLAAGLLSCATTLPPPAAGPEPAALLALRVTLHGARLGGGLESGSGGYRLGSLGLSMFNGEAAAARLQDRASGRVHYPTRFLNGFSLFVNIPPGSYRLDAVQIGTETTVYLSVPAAVLRVEGGGARYGGSFRLEFSPAGETLERAEEETEARDRGALARLLEERGQGRWTPPPPWPPRGS